MGSINSLYSPSLIENLFLIHSLRCMVAAKRLKYSPSLIICGNGAVSKMPPFNSSSADDADDADKL